MESKKHRRKLKHTVMVVSNRINDKVHQHNLSTVVALIIVVVLLACTGTAALCFYVDGVSLTSVSKSIGKLENQISDLKKTNSELEKTNSELQEKNSILGVTLDEKLKEEAERAAEEALLYIPSGLPASKVVSMNEITGQSTDTSLTTEDTYQNEDGETVISEEQANQLITAQSQNPIEIFELQSGSQIMASGYGTVITVSSDTEYTNVVKIDHGNGYVSIYRCSLNVIVNEGDVVTRGDVLFETSGETVQFGYQILLNAEYINPSDVMELKG